ncbi:hypothetical protein Tco_0067909, partial [Tanacetum coccineum]
MALISLTETMWALPSRSGKYPWRAFPFNLSQATCHPGLVSSATSRPGRRGFVAGDSGKCCSVPVKLDIDEMNYSSWVYFFKNLCKGHEILKHILGEPTDEATSSNPSPPTAEWLKIDYIVLSWIFMTLSKTLQQRICVEDPQTAKEDWDLIALIFKENKHTRSIVLKAEL